MLSHVRPLADHPQFDVVRTRLSDRQNDEVVEHRVYNFRRWKDGTIIRGDGSGWLDIAWTVGLAVLFRRYQLQQAIEELWSRWQCSVRQVLVLLGLIRLTVRHPLQYGWSCSHV